MLLGQDVAYWRNIPEPTLSSMTIRIWSAVMDTRKQTYVENNLFVLLSLLSRHTKASLPERASSSRFLSSRLNSISEKGLR